MKLLVVGSVALDSIITPFGQADDALGGSAVYFSVAASLLTGVRVVGVVGDDYPISRLKALGGRGIDLSGVEHATGESFRWKGKYSFDLSSRDTLETRLGVFAGFRPKIPGAFTNTPFVFLGNIHPDLQLLVLDQIRAPRLVACDTMNFWIESARERLLEVLKRVDMLVVNDEEIRELSGDWNVHRAARWVLARGPRRVVVKRGEHGALLVESGRSFFCPAYPLEEVFDPTGAGDAFAGGFLGYLARTGDLSSDGLRRAMVYGSAMGSYAVSSFSIGGFEGVTPAGLHQRVKSFEDLTHFEIAEALE
ncbi:MAG TPA: PfkB family carbohydrate kinase [Gemmatimonadales bacterium]|nr:PfkB family carbohydrate kinase [Gemmatimonadales bacterium]